MSYLHIDRAIAELRARQAEEDAAEPSNTADTDDSDHAADDNVRPSEDGRTWYEVPADDPGINRGDDRSDRPDGDGPGDESDHEDEPDHSYSHVRSVNYSHVRSVNCSHVRSVNYSYTGSPVSWTRSNIELRRGPRELRVTATAYPPQRRDQYGPGLAERTESAENLDPTPGILRGRQFASEVPRIDNEVRDSSTTPRPWRGSTRTMYSTRGLTSGEIFARHVPNAFYPPNISPGGRVVEPHQAVNAAGSSFERPRLGGPRPRVRARVMSHLEQRERGGGVPSSQEERLRQVNEVAVDFVGPLAKDMRCLICQERLDNGDCLRPTTILHPSCICGQTQLYCHRCIHTWLLQAQHGSCPVCRGRILQVQGAGSHIEDSTDLLSRMRARTRMRYGGASIARSYAGQLARVQARLMQNTSNSDSHISPETVADPPIGAGIAMEYPNSAEYRDGNHWTMRGNRPLYDEDNEGPSSPRNANSPYSTSDSYSTPSLPRDLEAEARTHERYSRANVNNVRRTRIYTVALLTNGLEPRFWDRFFSELIDVIAVVTEGITEDREAFTEAELSILETATFRGAAIAVERRNSPEHSEEFPAPMYNILRQNTEVLRRRLREIRNNPSFNHPSELDQVQEYLTQLRIAGAINPTTSEEEQQRLLSRLLDRSTPVGLGDFAEQTRRDFMGAERDNDGNSRASSPPFRTCPAIERESVRRAWNSYFGVIGGRYEHRRRFYPHSDNLELRALWNNLWGQGGTEAEARGEFFPDDYRVENDENAPPAAIYASGDYEGGNAIFWREETQAHADEEGQRYYVDVDGHVHRGILRELPFPSGNRWGDIREWARPIESRQRMSDSLSPGDTSDSLSADDTPELEQRISNSPNPETVPRAQPEGGAEAEGATDADADVSSLLS